MWKLDIDAAYRRVPVQADHRWACTVAFRERGVPMVSTHFATPFGATSSVWAWERVGAMITRIAQKVLRIPVLRSCVLGVMPGSLHMRGCMRRYVDDMFSADRPECVEHALDCMKRLVRALLGHDAVAESKAEHGGTLEVLGIEITPSSDGFTCRLSKKKAEKCTGVIDEALKESTLHPGVAQKLAGRLSWATQLLFRRLGRAMLRPLFKRAHSGYMHGSRNWAARVLVLALSVQGKRLERAFDRGTAMVGNGAEKGCRRDPRVGCTRHTTSASVG